MERDRTIGSTIFGAPSEAIAERAARPSSRESPYRLWIVAGAIACLLFGTWLRFSHLSTKYYSDDEMYSSLYVSGHSMRELATYAPHRIVTAGALLRRFQSPNAHRSTLDTIAVLARWDPEHPPLYYVVERGLQAALGNSVAARRFLAAAGSVLLLPAVFWLGTLIFDLSAAPWLAAALLAVSPFQLVYAQKVREYSLFELCAVVSAAFLIVAFRKRTPTAWTIFGVALALTLYSALFAVPVLLAYVAFACIRWLRTRDRVGTAGFGIATGAALAAFAPWLFELAAHWKYASSTNGWFAVPLPMKLYAAKVAFGVTSALFDAEYLHMRLVVFLIPVVIAAGYALWLFVRRAPREAQALIWSLIGATALTIACTDLLFHANRATQQRYLIVVLLGGEIAIAYGCAAAFASRGRVQQWVAVATTAVLLLGGASSSWLGSRQRSWWANSEAAPFAAVAHVVSRHPGAIVLTSPYWGVQLANVSSPNVSLAFDLSTATSSSVGPLYLLTPTPQLLEQVRRREGSAGSRVALATDWSNAQQRVHLQVARAHGRSVAFATTLYRF